MQTQAISNIKQNPQFQSKKGFEDAAAFVNMSDAQLQQMAYNSADKKEDKKAQRAITATFVAMPIVDSIASGILAKEKVAEAHLITPLGVLSNELKAPASMGTRLSRTAGTAIGWAYVLAVIGIYSAIKHQVVKDSPNAKKFGKDHPVLSFAGDLALIFGACVLGGLGLSKLIDKSGKKHTKTSRDLSDKMANFFEKINKGSFNQKTLPKIVEWFAKAEKEAPALTKTGKFLLANSVWILLGSAIVQMLTYGSRKHNKAEQQYLSLRTAQLETAKHMVRKLDVENDILSQNQKGLADDLDEALSGENPITKKELKELKADAQAYENIIERRAERADRDYEPEEVSEIQIIKIIHVPDKKEKHEKKIRN